MDIREDIQPWIIDALRENGGNATITQVAKHVWEHHKEDISKDEFALYNWQYEMRWAAGKLRKTRQLKAAAASTRGTWFLA
jgi:hypothetical protein